MERDSSIWGWDPLNFSIYESRKASRGQHSWNNWFALQRAMAIVPPPACHATPTETLDAAPYEKFL